MLADERVSRFLFSSSSHFKEKSKRVLYGAFLPHPDRKTASVYRTSRLNDAEIWRIDKEYVSKNERVSKARADILAKVIFENGLRILPLSDPHPRHADILNYPAEQGQIKLIAMKLAEASTLALKT